MTCHLNVTHQTLVKTPARVHKPTVQSSLFASHHYTTKGDKNEDLTNILCTTIHTENQIKERMNRIWVKKWRGRHKQYRLYRLQRELEESD